MRDLAPQIPRQREAVEDTQSELITAEDIHGYLAAPTLELDLVEHLTSSVD